MVDGQFGFGSLVQAPGLALDPERRGVDARFPELTGAGSERVVDETEPVRAWLVVEAGGTIPATADREDLELVAYDGRASIDELRERVDRGDTVADGEALAVFLQAP